MSCLRMNRSLSGKFDETECFMYFQNQKAAQKVQEKFADTYLGNGLRDLIQI